MNVQCICNCQSSVLHRLVGDAMGRLGWVAMETKDAKKTTTLICLDMLYVLYGKNGRRIFSSIRL